jgi:hypothetical protein
MNKVEEVLTELNKRKEKIEKEIKDISEGGLAPTVEEALKFIKDNLINVYFVSGPLFICNNTASQALTKPFLTNDSFLDYFNELKNNNKAMIIYMFGTKYENNILKIRCNGDFTTLEIENEIANGKYSQFTRFK